MRSRRKTPPADAALARSWVGKPIKDAFADTFGVVHGVEEGEDGKVRLLARFPGETTDRRILLEEPADPNDREFLMPGVIRAGYRPLDDRDRQRLADMRAAAADAPD